MDKMLKTIVEAIEDKKGENTVVLDLRGLDGSVADYFVICSAQSTTQVEAIAGEVEYQLLMKNKEKPFRIQGRENALWMVLDYMNVVIHVFERETRDYYGLEKLWSDAKIVKF